MSLVEWVAAALGIACVALAAKRNLWTYPTGIVSCALVGIVVWEAKLYSDALLQLFFVVVNGYGWWNWRKAMRETGELPVEWLTARERWGWGAGIAVATLVWGGLMHRFTDASYPWPDAAIAITSVVAQILLARRKVDNWLMWIMVDLASIPLYAAKALWIFAALYVAYLVLAVWGALDWWKVRRAAGPAIA
jgi:nicotinamide mononucleotide transporter